ncbi:MAG TPA: toll/interleukin-1 receptor domain-containing protein [Rhodoblastus sp.]|nr:toll/interleukin-1 receptor domain-containing protein [Rhodoblastus sp.]
MAGRSVFISHASKDRAIASEICERLEYNGVKCWIAPRDIPPGASYTAAIIDGLHECAVCLLVLSGNANRSGPVANEIERARSYGKLIVPLRIEDVLPGKELELYVSQSQWVDAFASPIADRIDYIATAVQSAELNQAPPAPPPQRLTAAAKAELLLERAVRHKILATFAAVALLAALGGAGLWMQFGTRDVVQRASESISGSAAVVSEAGKQIGAVGGKLDSIDAGVRGAKKETSLDPRKEVANLGAVWDQAAFEIAVIREDTRLVDLYLAGGMRVSALFVLATATREGPDISQQMTERIVKAVKADDRSACERLDASFVNRWLARPNIRRAAFSVCDADLVRSNLAARLKEREYAVNNHDRIVAEVDARKAKCRSELSNIYKNAGVGMDQVKAGQFANEIFEKHYISTKDATNEIAIDSLSRERAHFTMTLFQRVIKARNANEIIAYAIALTCAKKFPTPERAMAADLEPLRSAVRLISEK